MGPSLRIGRACDAVGSLFGSSTELKFQGHSELDCRVEFTVKAGISNLQRRLQEYKYSVFGLHLEHANTYGSPGKSDPVFLPYLLLRCIIWGANILDAGVGTWGSYFDYVWRRHCE